MSSLSLVGAGQSRREVLIGRRAVRCGSRPAELAGGRQVAGGRATSWKRQGQGPGRRRGRQERRMRAPTTLEKQRDQRPARRLTRRWVKSAGEFCGSIRRPGSGPQSLGAWPWPREALGAGQRSPAPTLTVDGGFCPSSRPPPPSSRHGQSLGARNSATPAAPGASGNPGALTRSSTSSSKKWVDHVSLPWPWVCREIFNCSVQTSGCN